MTTLKFSKNVFKLNINDNKINTENIIIIRLWKYVELVHRSMYFYKLLTVICTYYFTSLIKMYKSSKAILKNKKEKKYCTILVNNSLREKHV